MPKAKTKTAPEFQTPEEVKAEYNSAIAQGETLGTKVGSYRPSKQETVQVFGPHPEFDEACLVKYNGSLATCWINDNEMPPQAAIVKVSIKRSKSGEWDNISYRGEIVG